MWSFEWLFGFIACLFGKHGRYSLWQSEEPDLADGEYILQKRLCFRCGRNFIRRFKPLN